MDLAVEIAEDNKNNAAALALYDALEKPFAVYNNDEGRMFALIRLSLNLDRSPNGPHLVKSIAAIEPHVPWEWGFLKIRGTCYTATKHPLASDAQTDLVDYLLAEPGGSDNPGLAHK